MKQVSSARYAEVFRPLLVEAGGNDWQQKFPSDFRNNLAERVCLSSISLCLTLATLGVQR